MKAKSQNDWSPFQVCVEGARPPAPRSISTDEGLGDRLRTAAFAEFQAIRAFGFAADAFTDVPGELASDWRSQILDEVRHYEVIRSRMETLGFSLTDRPVSDRLWHSLREIDTGREFCIAIASAEDRGRQAALHLCQQLKGRDDETAAIFEEIARDEMAHVELAKTYFDWVPA